MPRKRTALIGLHVQYVVCKAWRNASLSEGVLVQLHAGVWTPMSFIALLCMTIVPFANCRSRRPGRLLWCTDARRASNALTAVYAIRARIRAQPLPLRWCQQDRPRSVITSLWLSWRRECLSERHSRSS